MFFKDSSLRIPAMVAAVFIVGVVASTAYARMQASSTSIAVPTHPTLAGNMLDHRDLEIAEQAWGYFSRNIQPQTGLVNSVDGFPSTTMWDTGSTLAAMLAAGDLGLISSADMHRHIDKLLHTLQRLELFNEEAPNKVYNTATAQMSDYRNQPDARGIGVSTLDLGRLVSWLQILSNMHPRYRDQAADIIERWSFCRLANNGQMFGLGRDDDDIGVLQEGRLGYEQYAARALARAGFNMDLAASYTNKHATQVLIEGVPITVDRRDASNLGAHNYVVAESYAMNLLEYGRDSENGPLFDNIVEVQRRRFQRTAQVTAVSEDNIDRAPWFVYNTIFTNSTPWLTLTDRGEHMNHLKTVSTKAAFSMAYLQPAQPYSKLLLDTVWQARNPKGGWYSGIYEKSGQFNKATTANTNGVILSLMLYRKYGPLHQICNDCGDGLRLSAAYMNRIASADHCSVDIARRSALATQKASQRKQLWAEQRQRQTQKQLQAIADLLQISQSQMDSGDTVSALETLSKAKRQTWQLSSDQTQHRQALRALMPEYDRLKAMWKAGNSTAGTTKLVRALASTTERVVGSMRLSAIP